MLPSLKICFLQNRPGPPLKSHQLVISPRGKVISLGVTTLLCDDSDFKMTHSDGLGKNIFTIAALCLMKTTNGMWEKLCM